MSQRPGTFNGMRHIALKVPNLEECERFYVDIMGMEVLRRHSENLLYLTCGNDNLSLGRSKGTEGSGCLDHFGFIVDTKDQLQQWFEFMQSQGVKLLDKPTDHVDGARSFHCVDPAGNVIQPIFHPSMSGQRFSPPPV